MLFIEDRPLNRTQELLARPFHQLRWLAVTARGRFPCGLGGCGRFVVGFPQALPVHAREGYRRSPTIRSAEVGERNRRIGTLTNPLAGWLRSSSASRPRLCVTWRRDEWQG